MEMLRRYFDSATKILGDREVECIAGTSDIARDGHRVEMRGMDTSAFLRSGTVLFNHDVSMPVGIPNSAHVDDRGRLRLGVTFAEDGASADADRVRKLVKGGTLRNLSIGFSVLDAVPLYAKRPRSGLKITRSELGEVSFVSVPADTGATVTARDWSAADLRARATYHAHDTDHRRRQCEALALAGVHHAYSADWQKRQRQKEVLERSAAIARF